MPTAWRLVRAEHAAAAFDGEGARLAGSRWNSVGVRMVYTTDTPTTAALEILAQDVRYEYLLAGWVIIAVEFPPGAVQVLDPGTLPPDWDALPWPASTRAIGDAWIASRASLVLQVPSAITAFQVNYLINPAHPAFPRDLNRGPAQPYRFPPRLLAKLRAGAS
ncbi:MAG TPA: RES family NAD+ phosphorylase [Candidatus Methylomirabilis sp.]|nr:RES family NAD+ phosphorylase [Candidatus Methylomirabilis sp.]